VGDLYRITKGTQATRALRGDGGNMAPLSGVFPDYFAQISSENGAKGHE
jgi:hypothetical protein